VTDAADVGLDPTRRHVPPDDPGLTWRGVVSLERGDGWVQPWRLPHADRLLFAMEHMQDTAALPYGGRIAFRSDTADLAGRVARTLPRTYVNCTVAKPPGVSSDMRRAQEEGARVRELQAPT
jgi:hypothetical protein